MQLRKYFERMAPLALVASLAAVGPAPASAATEQTANVFVRNNSGNTFEDVMVAHTYTRYPWRQSGSYGNVPIGGRTPDLTVRFETGVGSLTELDDWAVVILTDDSRVWVVSDKECQLQSDDAGHDIELNVTGSSGEGNLSLNLDLPSGSCSTSFSAAN